ncbi:MAG TPA: flagellar biosynthetic protein FliO [Ruminiclostridium sp.]|nr:flagellar biosynthetic protein FliO [Ruminiclostridium sp.]
MGWSILTDLLRMIGILIAIAVVFFLAWYVTRAVALNGSFNGKGKYFTVLEKFPITKDSYIMLIKSFDKLFIVGANPGGMTLLKELEADSVDLEEFKIEKQSFTEIFKTTLEATLPDGKLKEKINSFSFKKKGGGGDE